MEEDVSILGNMDSGSIIEFKDHAYVYTSVFVLTKGEVYDFCLEAGMYCTYTYRGAYQSKQIFQEMNQWIKAQGYEIASPYLEFLLIDVHETKDVEEYVTSIQVKVKQ